MEGHIISKSGAVVKRQKKIMGLKTTSNVKGHFKSSFAPLYHSLVTSLHVQYLQGNKTIFFFAPSNLWTCCNY